MAAVIYSTPSTRVFYRQDVQDSQNVGHQLAVTTASNIDQISFFFTGTTASEFAVNRYNLVK